MKKSLSVDEFGCLCNKLSPTEFIISSDNQKTSLIGNAINFNFVFPKIFIGNNPSMIYFEKDGDYIKLDRIKCIKQQEGSLLGNVFDIICSGFPDINKEFMYTVIVR